MLREWRNLRYGRRQSFRPTREHQWTRSSRRSSLAPSASSLVTRQRAGAPADVFAEHTGIQTLGRDVLAISDQFIPGPEDAPDVGVRIYDPLGRTDSRAVPRVLPRRRVHRGRSRHRGRSVRALGERRGLRRRVRRLSARSAAPLSCRDRRLLCRAALDRLDGRAPRTSTRRASASEARAQAAR